MHPFFGSIPEGPPESDVPMPRVTDEHVEEAACRAEIALAELRDAREAFEDSRRRRPDLSNLAKARQMADMPAEAKAICNVFTSIRTQQRANLGPSDISDLPPQAELSSAPDPEDVPGTTASMGKETVETSTEPSELPTVQLAGSQMPVQMLLPPLPLQILKICSRRLSHLRWDNFHVAVV